MSHSPELLRRLLEPLVHELNGEAQEDPLAAARTVYRAGTILTSIGWWLMRRETSSEGLAEQEAEQERRESRADVDALLELLMSAEAGTACPPVSVE